MGANITKFPAKFVLFKWPRDKVFILCDIHDALDFFNYITSVFCFIYAKSTLIVKPLTFYLPGRQTEVSKQKLRKKSRILIK